MFGWWDDDYQHPIPWVSRQDSAPRETLAAVVKHFMPEIDGVDGARAGEITGESEGLNSEGGGWGSAVEGIWSKSPELGTKGDTGEEQGHNSPHNWTAPFLSCGTSNCTADACYGVQRSAGLEKNTRTESAPTYVPAFSGHSAPGVGNRQEYESASSTPEHRQQNCVRRGIYDSDRISPALHQGQQDGSTRLCRNPTYSPVYRNAPTFARIALPGKQATGPHTICQGGDASATNAGVEEHYVHAGRMDPEVFRDWIPTPNPELDWDATSTPGKPSDATSFVSPALLKATPGKLFDAEVLADQVDMPGDNEASPVRRWMAAERWGKVTPCSSS